MRLARLLQPVTIATIVLIVAVSSGCSLITPPRDLSAPRLALLGHWQVKDPQAKKIAGWDDVYFSKTTVSYAEGTGQTSVTNRYQNRYSVISESTKSFSLVIEYVYQDLGTGKTITARKTVVFSADKNSLTFKKNNDTREVAEEKGPFTYVGSETAPR
jgi:hypothetical protein